MSRFKTPAVTVLHPGLTMMSSISPLILIKNTTETADVEYYIGVNLNTDSRKLQFNVLYEEEDEVDW